MIRHAVCTVSAAATLALTAAAPAIACDQPGSTSTASPQAQETPQAQQEHAKFAEEGFFRHHHHHHMRGFDQQAKSSDQQSSDQQSFDGQHQGNCDHGGTND